MTSPDRRCWEASLPDFPAARLVIIEARRGWMGYVYALGLVSIVPGGYHKTLERAQASARRMIERLKHGLPR